MIFKVFYSTTLLGFKCFFLVRPAFALVCRAKVSGPHLCSLGLQVVEGSFFAVFYAYNDDFVKIHPVTDGVGS